MISGNILTAKNNTFYNNTSTTTSSFEASSLYSVAKNAYITNNTFVSNTVGFSSQNSTLHMQNNIIANNLNYDYVPYNTGVILNNLGNNIVKNQHIQTATGSTTWKFADSTDILWDGTTYLKNSVDMGSTLNLDTTIKTNDTQNGTLTLALLTDSIAIDAENLIDAPSRDQRGYLTSGEKDIGAYEVSTRLIHPKYHLPTIITYLLN